MSEPKPEQVEIMQFTCPECGGHTFGQTPKFGGMCHGERKGSHQPCNFRFKFDDPRYFKGTGKFMPRTVTGKSMAKA